MPRLTDFAEQFPLFAGLTVHLGLIFGIILAAIMWITLERTRWGYEIKLIGDNPKAARYAGIDIARKIIIVFVISGALAGLGGISEVTGVVHRLQDQYLTGLRLHRDHHRVPGPVRAVPGHHRLHPVRRADPRGSRDPGRRACRPWSRGSSSSPIIGSDVLVRYRIRFARPMVAT